MIKKNMLKSNNIMNRFYAVVLVCLLVAVCISGVTGSLIFTNDTVGDLQSRFTGLTAGTRLFIPQPATPYRSTGWLDIDVSDVVIEFQSPFAANGEPIVKVADSSNVGGIRIGWGSAADNVQIINFGFDGNKDNQVSGTKLHGIYVNNSDNVLIRNSYFTYTYPYHQHSTGGSGISCTQHSSNVTIKDVTAKYIGDRFIQLGGCDITIENVLSYDGYDRVVFLDLEDYDGTDQEARNVYIDNVRSYNCSAGSVIGLGYRDTSDCKNYVIKNIYTFGERNSAIKIDVPAENIIIDTVIVEGQNEPILTLGDNFQIHNVTVTNVQTEGITSANGLYVNASNLTLENVNIKCEDYGIHLNDTSNNITIRDCRFNVKNRAIYTIGHIENFTIEDNKIIGRTHTMVGILFTDAHHGFIRNNIIYGGSDASGDIGIDLRDCSYVRVEFNHINGYDDSNEIQQAIILQTNTHNCSIIGNSFMYCYGIFIITASGADWNVIWGNDFTYDTTINNGMSIAGGNNTIGNNYGADTSDTNWLIIPVATSNPYTTDVEGAAWVNSSTSEFCIYSGSTWIYYDHK